MTQVIVTVNYGTTHSLDLSLPWKVPTHMLLQGLPIAFGLIAGVQQPLLLGMKKEGGFRQIATSETLAEAEVVFGDRLELFPWKRGYLLASDQRKFWLNDVTTRIGRSSPDLKVDIDLAYLDTPMLVSRQHASITHNYNRYFIKDENSRNGVLVNGMKLPPGQRHPLNQRDMVHFGGKSGISLSFHITP